MKKLSALLLAAALLLTCSACQQSDQEPEAEQTGSITTDQGNEEGNEETTPESGSETETESEPKPEPEAMRDITTLELVHEMGYGINLGNTLEACGDWISNDKPENYMTAWGSPVITKEIIQAYADAGFGVLRIPVAWSNMMVQDGTYTINPEYAALVKQVVDWTLETGMYAIINIHWDNGWVNEFPNNKEESMKRFTRMWTQIAELFENCGDKLMFESQNEELGWDSIWSPWSGDKEKKKESFDLVNEVNQAFVDTIRSGGGNNPQRHLLISGYSTGIERCCDELFKMPDDPANRMALSVHYYNPSTLCLLDSDADWGEALTEWGSDRDIAILNREMKLLKKHFVDNGIPVIVGEYGCFGDNKPRELREYWMTTVSKAMYEIGACPILWDTPGGECDRENARFSNPEFIKELLRPWKESE